MCNHNYARREGRSLDCERTRGNEMSDRFGLSRESFMPNAEKARRRAA